MCARGGGGLLCAGFPVPETTQGEFGEPNAPAPLVHERRSRGSRGCTEPELNVAVVHGTSRNPITERAVVHHETRPLRGFANRTAGRAFRCAAAEEPAELNRWLS